MMYFPFPYASAPHPWLFSNGGQVHPCLIASFEPGLGFDPLYDFFPSPHMEITPLQDGSHDLLATFADLISWVGSLDIPAYIAPAKCKVLSGYADVRL